tara:strand:+ start:240 stop:1298 length:1059 start_codon:yes stop_codon:yes gene_type:complete
LTDKEQINLKPTWVMNKLVTKNKKWDVNSLSIFINSLPHNYDFDEPDFIKLCLMINKDTFIKALFLYTQDNASIEYYAARDTTNSSSSLCDTLVDLRFEDMFSAMPGIEEITGIEHMLQDNTFDDPFIRARYKNFSQPKKKWRAYYLEDINFLMSLIILFSTCDPKKDSYFYKIRYSEDEEIKFPDIEHGKEILFTKFFDGTKAKYKNKMNSLINRALNALTMLPNTKLEKIYISEIFDKDFPLELEVSEYKDIFLGKQYVSSQGTKIMKCKEMFQLRRGDTVGINNMVGASKIIAHYRNYFSKKDIDFLINEKAYDGEMSYISCKKSFDLLDKHIQKEYLPIDKNAYIFSK